MTARTTLRNRLAAVAAVVALAAGSVLVGGASPASAATVSCTISTTKTVRSGDSGSCVRLLQQRLGGLVVDGSFGSLTSRAVIFFQRANGLAADGIVGSKTWSKIKAGLPKAGTTIYSLNNIHVWACRDSVNTAVRYAVRNNTSVDLRRVTLWRSATTSGTYVDYINRGQTKSGGIYQVTSATEGFRALEAEHKSGKTSTAKITFGFTRGTLPVCR